MFSQQFFSETTGFLLDFSFYYPLFMAYVWMVGAVNYYYRFERRSARLVVPDGINFEPPISVLVPMHNEEANAEETILHALALDYPDLRSNCD